MELPPYPLTDCAIRNAKPQPKPYRITDGAGMYLEVAPGGGKWWRLKYRIAGAEKRVSLGVFPDVGLGEARERRDEARRLIARETPLESTSGSHTPVFAAAPAALALFGAHFDSPRKRIDTVKDLPATLSIAPLRQQYIGGGRQLGVQ